MRPATVRSMHDRFNIERQLCGMASMLPVIVVVRVKIERQHYIDVLTTND